jgi:hypothetical protein
VSKTGEPRRMLVDRLFWAVCILLGALLLKFGLTKLADAHIPGHEEWNDVLSTSKNQYNGQCCGLGDAQLVELMTGGGRSTATTKSTFSDSGGASSRGRSPLTK